MAHRRNIAVKEVTQIEAAIDRIEPVNSLYDCVKRLAPKIQERHQAGVPLGRLYDVAAKQIGCSSDAVARHFRRALEESQRQSDSTGTNRK